MAIQTIVVDIFWSQLTNRPIDQYPVTHAASIAKKTNQITLRFEFKESIMHDGS